MVSRAWRHRQKNKSGVKAPQSTFCWRGARTWPTLGQLPFGEAFPSRLAGRPFPALPHNRGKIMLASGFAMLGTALWTAWVPLGAGAAVTSLVVAGGVVYGRWRGGRRLNDASREEDLAWADLLGLLQQR